MEGFMNHRGKQVIPCWAWRIPNIAVTTIQFRPELEEKEKIRENQRTSTDVACTFCWHLYRQKHECDFIVGVNILLRPLWSLWSRSPKAHLRHSVWMQMLTLEMLIATTHVNTGPHLFTLWHFTNDVQLFISRSKEYQQPSPTKWTNAAKSPHNRRSLLFSSFKSKRLQILIISNVVTHHSISVMETNVALNH